MRGQIGFKAQVFSHLTATFWVGHYPKNFILRGVLEEEHSENHFLIRSFLPSHGKYVLSGETQGQFSLGLRRLGRSLIALHLHVKSCE